MIMETIQVVKSGVCIREFPSQFYSLQLISGIVIIVDKQTRKTSTVLSPNVYDYVEMTEQEIETEETE